MIVVEMPSGSKPTSPTIEPSSAGGFFKKGMDAERSTAIAGVPARMATPGADAPASESGDPTRDNIWAEVGEVWREEGQEADAALHLALLQLCSV